MKSQPAPGQQGYLNRIGSFHMHIDGYKNRGALEQVLRDGLFHKAGYAEPKLTVVTATIAGSQAEEADFKETYDHHNPMAAGDPSLDYFATIDLTGAKTDLSSASVDKVQKTRQFVIQTLKELLPKLVTCPGVIVEVERIVGKRDRDNKWSEVTGPMVERFSRREFGAGGINLASTHDYEIHHAFDLPKNGGEETIELAEQPIRLDELKSCCEQHNINVGGWFVFQGQNEWLYRSNLFAKTLEESFEIAQEQDVQLRGFLEGRKETFRLKTIVEQVLGIWTFRPTPA